MQELSQALGDTVKVAREQLGLTQNQVAAQISADRRTVLNIENYKSNPKMETLYPLIRTLRIDAREIFNPEIQRESPAIRKLRFAIEDCNEQEAALVPIIEIILKTLRASTSDANK